MVAGPIARGTIQKKQRVRGSIALEEWESEGKEVQTVMMFRTLIGMGNINNMNCMSRDGGVGINPMAQAMIGP
jgi:hypothetical protein